MLTLAGRQDARPGSTCFPGHRPVNRWTAARVAIGRREPSQLSAPTWVKIRRRIAIEVA
jgi:hypothetical protein